jgi:hypothetical protein
MRSAILKNIMLNSSATILLHCYCFLLSRKFCNGIYVFVTPDKPLVTELFFGCKASWVKACNGIAQKKAVLKPTAYYVNYFMLAVIFFVTAYLYFFYTCVKVVK